jgi:uncharacterized alkaline shock family protein YloU
LAESQLKGSMGFLLSKIQKPAYGICIPEKADEIQLKVTQELSRLTGLHVSLVHVIFKNLITKTELAEAVTSDKEYSEEF